MGVWTKVGVRMAGLAVAAALVLVTGAAARADEPLDKANKLYSNIQKDRRSDLVLLPVLSKMELPPKQIGDYLAAALMTTGNVSWSAAETWAKAKPQQDALDALKKVTAEEDWRKAWAFGQSYGAAAVDPEFVDIGLYTELGEDGTLAAADFKYLVAVRRLEILCHVEATRLLAAGKGDDALELMRRWALFSYQIASRELLKEKMTGMEMLVLSFARMRDLAYTDMMAEKHSMTAEGVRDVIAKLSEKNPINSERISLPLAERYAAEQLVARTFLPDGKPNRESFATIYARVASGNRPLRRFSESAKWDTIMGLHGSRSETDQMIGAVYGDWAKRWDLNQWDPIQEIPTDYMRLDKVKFASLDLVMGDVGLMFPARRMLRVEWIGTRAALGCYGYVLQQHNVPVLVTSVVPVFVRDVVLLADPFDKAAKEGRGKRLGYIRPTIDNNGKIQIIRVFPKVAGVEYNNFEAPVGAGQFVLYSAGPDGNQNSMDRATQMVKDEKGDYLIWPPVISLTRQHLTESARTDSEKP